MGCHIYIYDKQRREIFPQPVVSVSSDHEGEKHLLPLDAHRFIEKVRVELGCRELSPDEKVRVFEQFWRNTAIDPKERIAVNLDWIIEIINSPEFGYLDCG